MSADEDGPKFSMMNFTESIFIPAVIVVAVSFFLRQRGNLLEYLISRMHTAGMIIVFSFFALSLLCYFGHSFLVFVPMMPPGARTNLFKPERFGLSEKSVFLECRDGTKIHSWLFKQPEDVKDCPTIIYFHGNAGNISYSLPITYELVKTVKCNVFMVEYHGYGLSEGSPSEANLALDAEAALQYILTEEGLSKEKIVVFGTSVGAAIASRLVLGHQDEIACLIIENTFTCVYDAALKLFWLFTPLIKLFCFAITTKLDTTGAMPLIRIPTLFISGRQDEILPVEMMDELYRECGSQVKKLLKFKCGKHNETFLENGYFEQVKQFIDDTIN